MKTVVCCVLACAALAGCKGKKKEGAGPAANGSAAVAGRGDAVAAVAVDAPPAVPADAAPPPAFPTTISDKGVGPITTTTTADQLAALFPGLTAQDANAEWISFVTQGKTVALRARQDVATKAVTRVLVDDAMFSTLRGVRVGSPGTHFAIAYPDAVCEFGNVDGAPKLWCTSKAAPELTFYFDAKAYKGQPGRMAIRELAAMHVSEIQWNAPEPKPNK